MERQMAFQLRRQIVVLGSAREERADECAFALANMHVTR
jgi:hypothetical protein